MKLSHELIRVFGDVFGDDGEGIEFSTAGLGPDVVQPGKGNELVALGVDVVGRLVPAITLPFIYIDMSREYAWYIRKSSTWI
jgi:hypothetical protein